MKLNNELKCYIVDVYGYIRSTLTLTVVAFIIKGIVWGFTDNDWIVFWVIVALNGLCPNKEYIEKWLDVKRCDFL